MERTPLYEAQQQLGATFCMVGDCSVAARFGDVAAEYEAAQTGAAVADATHGGRILARGKDTLDLLNRLSTNLVDPLPDGAGQTTVITTGKGRIVDWITMLPWGEDFLLLTSPGRQGEVADWIDTFTFDEDTTLQDITESTIMVSVLGPGASSIVERALGVSVAGLPSLGCASAEWRGEQALVARTDPAGQPGFSVVVPADSAEALWRAALAEGATPAGRDALEALRIGARIPQWGNEFTDDNNPLEAGLLGEVSWTKGCYTGQEVVARLYNYHRIQRFMVSVELPAGEDWPAGVVLLADGAAMGRVTSISPIIRDGVQAGLALVRAAHARAGATLHAGENGPAITITWAPEEAQQGAAA